MKIIAGSLGQPKKTERDVVIECFSCCRSFVYHGSKPDGICGRFCSDRCHDWFDAGNSTYEPVDYRKLFSSNCRHAAGPDAGYMVKPMRLGPVGFYINGLQCGREFESKGLRCCSTKCEQAYRDREENVKAMVAVGMEPAAKRHCLECGAVIPRWRNGRRTRADAQFCQSSHRRKYARRIANSAVNNATDDLGDQTRSFDLDHAKEVPVLRGLETANENTPVPIGRKARVLPRHVEPDAKYADMYRVRRADGTLSDIMNLTRAKEATQSRCSPPDQAPEDHFKRAA